MGIDTWGLIYEGGKNDEGVHFSKKSYMAPTVSYIVYSTLINSVYSNNVLNLHTKITIWYLLFQNLKHRPLIISTLIMCENFKN